MSTREQTNTTTDDVIAELASLLLAPCGFSTYARREMRAHDAACHACNWFKRPRNTR